ncbi:MAG: YARHG domain-containing protein [Prevotellaceae bacterium]|jgi:hypothetical protein|nr:YARHG domain-containing protein [Prevotellaceae bacterium]
MKKIIFTTLIFIGFTALVFSQSNFSYPELISQDSIVLLSVHQGQLITVTKNKNKKFLLSLSNKTDTLKVDFPFYYWTVVPMYHNNENSIYFQSVHSQLQTIKSLYKLNLETKTITKIENLEGNIIFHCIIGNNIILQYNNSIVYAYNMKNMAIDSLFDGGISFRISDEFLIEYKILIGYYEAGDIVDFSVYDYHNKKMIYPVQQLDTIAENTKSRVKYYYKDITHKYYSIGLYWINSTLNIIQPTLLPANNSYSSNNLSKIHDIYYYRRSYIDRNPLNNSVWVICKFTLAFDKALYDIYHNTLLEKIAIENFDEWELDKLKNMIFAKHGYQFQSEYLQAFYNLFDFYNHITKTNDVNALLTPEDKKNLELIKQLSKKK